MSLPRQHFRRRRPWLDCVLAPTLCMRRPREPPMYEESSALALVLGGDPASAAMGAYTISDRGTWIHFQNKGDLVVAVEGDKRLFNQYGVMLVNPAKHP